MVKRRTTATPNRGAPPFLRRDLLGQKYPIVKGIPNNYLYIGGGTLALLAGAFLANEQGWVDLSLFGLAPNGVTASAAANPAVVKTGDPVKITGDVFGRNGQPLKLNQIFLGVWEDTGDQMFNSLVGQNTSHFEALLQTSNYRDGNYYFAVDWKPVTGKPPELQNVPQYTNLPTPISPGGAAFPGQPQQFGVTIT